ncbi:MAG: PP2C family protein-serine/threonine phosphatase [Phycisphaerales bacterium]|nr:serine/threonine-protein phosphatase [Planctomycetota bacterium]
MARVLFCGKEPGEASVARLLAPVLAAWPSEDLPEVRSIPLDEVLESARAGTFLPEGVLGLLIDLDDDIAPAKLAALCEFLHGGLLPAIVVTARERAVGPVLHKHGVIVVAEGTPSTQIAAMLYTLCERQPLVAHLGREVGTGKRADRGMRGEMDRLHEELHLASTVQRELLPQKLPEDAELEFASLYHPATYVSGDLFDARVLDEHRLVFFIADAVGHGVPAALITMMLSRALINQFALCSLPGAKVSPGACLAGLNRELCQHASGNYRFATAVCGVLDKRDFSITIAGAGHPPSLLMKGGQTRSFESQGPLLGVFAEAEYSDETFILEPGATLLLYTDGFELAFPSTDCEARDRKVAPREYLKHMNVLDEASGGGDVRESMDRLASLIAGQEGSLHQRDDVTALAIRRRTARALRQAA